MPVTLINCAVSGSEIYTWIGFPVVPRKGDILDMGSLTSGVTKGRFIVSTVEWFMEQHTRTVYPHLTVRRTR